MCLCVLMCMCVFVCVCLCVYIRVFTCLLLLASLLFPLLSFYCPTPSSFYFLSSLLFPSFEGSLTPCAPPAPQPTLYLLPSFDFGYQGRCCIRLMIFFSGHSGFPIHLLRCLELDICSSFWKARLYRGCIVCLPSFSIDFIV